MEDEVIIVDSTKGLVFKSWKSINDFLVTADGEDLVDRDQGGYTLSMGDDTVHGYMHDGFLVVPGNGQYNEVIDSHGVADKDFVETKFIFVAYSMLLKDATNDA